MGSWGCGWREISGACGGVPISVLGDIWWEMVVDWGGRCRRDVGAPSKDWWLGGGRAFEASQKPVGAQLAYLAQAADGREVMWV